MASANDTGESPESTAASSLCSDGKYQVERILAQEEGDDEVMYYLVKWEGYGDEQCTWEVAESFDSPTTISIWRNQLATGDVPSDDQIDQIQARMDAFQESQQEQQEKSNSGGSNHQNALTSELDGSHPSPGGMPSSDLARLSLGSRFTALKPAVLPSSKTSKGSDLRKRRRSSLEWDPQSDRVRPVKKSRSINSKVNQVPPPVGLIKASEIEYREPGHSLPATTTVERPDTLLPVRYNSRIGSGSTEAFQPASRQFTSHTEPTRQYSTGVVPPRSVTLNRFMVYLSVGTRTIGHVTVTGLPSWLSHSLSNVMHGSTITLEFEQKFVVSWHEYSQISSSWMMPALTLGYGQISASGTTQAIYENAARCLEESNSGAIWVSPNPTDTYALVLYPSKLSHWDTVQCKPEHIQPVPLHLGLRNRVRKGQIPPPLAIPAELLEKRLAGSATVPKPAIAATSATTAPAPPPSHQQQPQQQQQQPNSTGLESPTQRRKSLSREERRGLVKTPTRPVLSRQDAPVGSENGSRIIMIGPEIVLARRDSKSTHATTSQEKLGASDKPKVEKTDSVATGTGAAGAGAAATSSGGACDLDYRSIKCWESNQRPLVYIAFGRNHPAEAKEVREWASRFTSRRFIFIEGLRAKQEKDKSEDYREWKAFQDTCGSIPALILFCDDDAVFCNMPNFGSLLGKYRKDMLLCHSLSWRKTTDTTNGNRISHGITNGNDNSDSEHNSKPRYTSTEIFNHGTVLLLTEAAMKNHAAMTVRILEWFKEQAQGKSNPEHWKIMLRPKIRRWLTQQVFRVASAGDGDGDKNKNPYLDMLTLLSQLMPGIDVTDGDVSSLRCLDAILSTADKSQVNYVIPLTRLQGYSSSAAPAARDDNDNDNDRDDEEEMRKRDEALISYFVGWSALNVDHHRRFLVIDDRDHVLPLPTCGRNQSQTQDGNQGGDQNQNDDNNTIHHAHHVVFRRAAQFATELTKSRERHEKRR